MERAPGQKRGMNLKGGGNGKLESMNVERESLETGGEMGRQGPKEAEMEGIDEENKGNQK
jgi:hypothetical protein